ncbi:type II secretion system secretin GspD [Pseudomonas sp. L-22-4S-12]|uniref:type II secretion system secretin GspD n=1 Tax=Pseudomonas sp. L-22-4S-12 TaxID=2610893 RepID=UPI00132860AF|nr:type II secretion system secretin GspD [Pseudomonas sp. L-22-4S-12]MWV18187.1 type II secretion system secretin GspD [Pseudomonas sp. L-22-4S-12]
MTHSKRVPPKHLPLALLLAISCLGAPLPPAQAAITAGASSQQGESWTINMKDADIRDFIEQVSSISGQTFVIDPRVKGQVTVMSQAPLGLSEVYQLFLSVMSTHGFSVIAEDDQARIVPNAEARADGSAAGTANTLETRVLQVQQNSVTELIPLIRPLVPQYGHLAAVASANALIISDRPANIARIEQLVRQLDQANQQDYTVYDMRHAWVMDAAEVLNNTLNRGQAKGTASATQVVADSRTNRLLLLGPAEARAKMLALAKSIDTPSSRSANTRVIRLRHNDAKTLAETLGEISESLKSAEGSAEGGSGKPKQMLIRADESLNALVILADPETVSMLEDIVRQLDVPRAQVLVEAAIVEISGDIRDALGVQWAAKGSDGIGGVNFNNTGLSIGTFLGALQDQKLPTPLPNGAIIGIGNSDFGALITALSSNSKSNLLSTPTLLTLDNQKAEILVGQNVPFQTGSYTTSTDGASNPFTTIERQDIGVTLKVTPHINEGATLRLEIEQEISSLVPSPANVTVSDVITNKRSIKSTILANDGQVIVLGGLIQDDVTRTDSKVPILGDIPLLGRLFRSTEDTHVKRNLMVFLRPAVVRDANGLANLSNKKYSDIRVLSQPIGDEPGLLPSDPQRLFDPRDGAEPAIDLRPQP